MVWVYDRTESLLLAVLMHVSLTASLLILNPLGISRAAPRDVFVRACGRPVDRRWRRCSGQSPTRVITAVHCACCVRHETESYATSTERWRAALLGRGWQDAQTPHGSRCETHVYSLSSSSSQQSAPALTARSEQRERSLLPFSRPSERRTLPVRLARLDAVATRNRELLQVSSASEAARQKNRRMPAPSGPADFACCDLSHHTVSVEAGGRPRSIVTDRLQTDAYISDLINTLS